MRPTVSADAILKIFIDTNLHLDRIIWSQFQTLFAIEAATLVGGYTLRGTALSFYVVFIGIIFLALLYLYVWRIRENRDVNMGIVDDIIKEFADDSLKTVMKQIDNKWIRLAVPMPDSKYGFGRGIDGKYLISGHAIFTIIFAVVATIDVIAIVLFPSLPKAGVC